MRARAFLPEAQLFRLIFFCELLVCVFAEAFARMAAPLDARSNMLIYNRAARFAGGLIFI